jgi:O-antigen ligase
MALAELIIFLFLWLTFQHSEFRKSLNTIEKLFLVFILVLLISSFFGVDPSKSFWSNFDRMTGGLMWLHLFGIFFVLPRVLRHPNDWQHFFWIVTIIGLVISVFHLVSFTGIDVPFFIQRDSTIGNSTFFGVYILFQIYFSFFLIISQKHWKQVFGFFEAGIFILTLLTSEAQAVIWAFWGSLILLGAILSIVYGKKKMVVKYFGFTIVGILLIGLVTGFILLFQTDSLVRNIVVKQASGGRFAAWEIALQGIKERPILGWGLENFDSVFFKNYHPCFGSSACGGEMWFDRAHNKLLDVWVESGFVGLVLYLGLFLFTLYGLWKGYVLKRVDGVTSAIITSAFAAYFVQNLVGLDVSITYLFWLILLAYASVLTPSPQSSDRVFSHQSFFLAVGVIFFPIAFFFFIIQPLRGNLAIHHWFFAKSAEERIAAYERATSLSLVGIDARRWYLARQLAGKLWIASMKNQTMDIDAQKEIQLAEMMLRDTVEKKQGLLLNDLHLGLVYHTEAKFFDASKFQTAEQILNQTIVLNPRNPQPLWALAAVFLEQGKVMKAFELTQQAVDLNPKVIESHLQRLIAVKFIGDIQLFEKYAQETIAFFPNTQAYVNLIRSADLKEKKSQLIFELY